MNKLILEQRCQDCEGGVLPLKPEQAQEYLKNLINWEINSAYTHIVKIYTLKNYYEVISFVNASAWISHNENHHPELIINYQTCTISYTTHVINGLSINDFICAKKLDELIYSK